MSFSTKFPKNAALIPKKKIAKENEQKQNAANQNPEDNEDREEDNMPE